MSKALIDAFTREGRTERELKSFEEIIPLIRSQFGILDKEEGGKLELWIIYKRKLIISGQITVNAIIDEIVVLVENQMNPTIIENVD